jgi:hypothetical protein
MNEDDCGCDCNSCEKSIRDVANSLRELKNWIAVFAEEYKLPGEAVEKLDEKIKEIVELIKEIECN